MPSGAQPIETEANGDKEASDIPADVDEEQEISSALNGRYWTRTPGKFIGNCATIPKWRSRNRSNRSRTSYCDRLAVAYRAFPIHCRRNVVQGLCKEPQNVIPEPGWGSRASNQLRGAFLAS
jgi:hypothetical protein